MRNEGTYTFAVPLRQLRAALRNPDALMRAIPGCERLTQMGPADALGVATYEVRLRLQPSTMPLQATLRVAQPSEREFRVEMHGLGPEGSVTARGSITLLDQGPKTQSIYFWETIGGATTPSAPGAHNGTHAESDATREASENGSGANGANGANGSAGNGILATFYTNLETLASAADAAVSGTGPLLVETPRGRIQRQAPESTAMLDVAPSRALLIGASAILVASALVLLARMLGLGRRRHSAGSK